MKKRIASVVLALALCLGLTVPALAASPYIWDTSSESQEMAKNRITNTDWEDIVQVDGLYDIGYVKYCDDDYATVCYCDAPARVTLLTVCDVMELGGSMVRYYFDEGWLDSAGTVEPTHLVPVESEEFGTINGEGTYWDLDEGIYYMFSVNASKTLFIVVGDRLGKAVTDGENAYYHDSDTMTLSLKCWQTDADLRHTLCAFVGGVRSSFTESVKYWRYPDSAVMTNLYYAVSGAVIYPAPDAVLEDDNNNYSFRYITYTEVELAENAYGELYAIKMDNAVSQTVSEAVVVPDGLYEVTVTCCETSNLPGDNGGAVYPVLTFYLAVGDGADTTEEVSFTDVTTSDWFYDAVNWAVSEGVTNGTGGGGFSPSRDCTQAEILTFLWRAVGEPESSLTGSPYSSSAVTEDQYFYEALLWAWETGIVTSKKLDPHALCQRSDVVTYLWRLDGKPSYSGSEFPDVPASASYAAAVAWAVDHGITNGTGDGHFNPERICSRSQIVTFLYRYFVN